MDNVLNIENRISRMRKGEERDLSKYGLYYRQRA